MIEPTTEPTTDWGATLQRTYDPPGPPASEARLFKLGEEIALLSARIQAATYQLLVLLQSSTRTRDGEVFDHAPSGCRGAQASHLAQLERRCAWRDLVLEGASADANREG